MRATGAGTALLACVAISSAYVTVRTTQPDGTSTTKTPQNCQELAPGVNYCAEMGSSGMETVVEVTVSSLPDECFEKVQKTSYLLMHFVGSATPQRDSSTLQWTQFVAVEDFTHATAVKLGVGETVKGWDLGLEGLCEGTKAVIVVPPELGYDEQGTALPRPAAVPMGATLRYEIEIIKILKVAPDGVPFRPCFFSLIDTDGSNDLDEVELARHFARIKKPVPPHVMNEDLDGDGRISFDEFTGPKIKRDSTIALPSDPTTARAVHTKDEL